MRKITLKGERHLIRTANLEPKMTLKALGSPSKSGKKLNYYTVAQVLKRNGKAKRRLRKKPFLTEEHKKRRVAHCKAEKAIKRDNWKVCWSDEVTFEVREDLNTFWVIRALGREEEYADKNLQPTFKSGRTIVGVWSCFCRDEMGPLYMLLEGKTMIAK
jgi:hypothetical protein